MLICQGGINLSFLLVLLVFWGLFPHKLRIMILLRFPYAFFTVFCCLIVHLRWARMLSHVTCAIHGRFQASDGNHKTLHHRGNAAAVHLHKHAPCRWATPRPHAPLAISSWAETSVWCHSSLRLTSGRRAGPSGLSDWAAACRAVWTDLTLASAVRLSTCSRVPPGTGGGGSRTLQCAPGQI